MMTTPGEKGIPDEDSPDVGPVMPDADSMGEAPPRAVEFNLQLEAGANEKVPSESQPDFAETLRLMHDALQRSQSVTRIVGDPEAQDSMASEAMTLTFDSPGSQSDPAEQLSSVSPLLARFEVVRFLGRGGFGTVFLANDQFLGRQVAIKVPHMNVVQTKSLRERFLLESRASARLNHPNIVRVLDAGGSEDSLWQVAEFVDGPSLKIHLRNLKERMPVLLAVELICSLADAVHHAHQEGVLHRDIKPDNILLEERATVDADGESTRLVPRLTDFGLARLLDEETNLSRTGELIGTPRYMAPEQLSGKPADVGEQTDVYSLGVILHELLTGQIPFPDNTSLASRNVIVTTPVPSLRISRPDLPRDLETICLKCLHGSPMRRYRTAAELRDDLSRFLDGRPTLARPLPWYEQFWLWTRRRPAVASSMAVIFVALTAFLIQSYLTQQAIRRRNVELTETTDRLRNTTDRLRRESERSQALMNVARENERLTSQREAEYESLARQSTTQNALASLQKRDYQQTRQLLEKLRAVNASREPRTEAGLIQAELSKRSEIILDAGFPIHEMVTVPGTSLVIIAGDSSQQLVFDCVSRKVQQTLDGPIATVHALAISPDGELLALGGGVNEQDVAVPRLIRWRTGKLVREFPGQPTTIESLAFSPDGKKLLCGSRYEPVLMFDLADAELPPVTIQTDRRNEWFVFRDGEVAVLAKPDTVTWSEIATGNLIRTTTFPSPRSHAALIPGSDILAVARYNEFGVDLQHVESDTPMGRLKNREKSLQFVVGTESPCTLYGGRIDGSLVRWKIPEEWLSGRKVPPADPVVDVVDEVAAEFVGRIHRQPITAIRFLNEAVLCASLDGTVSALPVKELEGDAAIPVMKSIWYSLAIHPIDGQIWMGLIDNKIERFPATRSDREKHLKDLFETRLTAQYDAVDVGQPAINGLAFRSDGQLVAWSDWQGRVLIRPQADQGTIQQIYLSPSTPVTGMRALVFSPDGRWLAWGDTDKNLFVADCLNGFSIRTLTLPRHADGIAFSPDCQHLAVGTPGANLILVDVPSMAVVGRLPDFHECYALHWMADGSSLVAGFVDGSIRRVDPLNPKRADRGRQFMHRSRVVQVLEIPDTKLAVSVDTTGEVVLWNHMTLEVLGLLCSPPIPENYFADAEPVIRWMNDGRLILAWIDADYGPQSREWRLTD